MTPLLHLDCSSGISGDMTVAALLDLGADRAALDSALASLPLGECRVEISRVKKAGLDCCDFRVVLDTAHENHDHDMAYLHGHEPHSHGHDHAHEHEHTHDHEHEHTHDHEHEHAHDHDHAHPHEHRGLAEIRAILAACTMTDRARETATRIFDVLASAESKAHGVPVEEVHFHEVGAIDSIVDIVAAAVCFDSLGVAGVVVPELTEGTGTVRCQHGILPIPVPAVAAIAAESGLRLRIGDVHGELVTPTGAAIAAVLRTDERLPESGFRILRTGLGAGKREYERPSILRAMLIEPAPAESGADENRVAKLECELDDCTGEALGFAMERLLGAGALEVDYAPVFMKKNRPGWRLTALCPLADVQRFATLVLENTSTLGVRWCAMERRTLSRAIRQSSTPWGGVAVKEATLPGGGVRRHAEYDDAARIARETGLSFRAVADAAERG